MLRNKQEIITRFEYLDKSKADIVYSSTFNIVIIKGSVFDIFEFLKFRDTTTPLKKQFNQDKIFFYTDKLIISGLHEIIVSWFDNNTKEKDFAKIIELNKKLLEKEKNDLITKAEAEGRTIYFSDYFNSSLDFYNQAYK